MVQFGLDSVPGKIKIRDKKKVLEHRAGIEPANTGFADQRVSHFATGAHLICRAGCAAAI